MHFEDSPVYQDWAENRSCLGSHESLPYVRLEGVQGEIS